MKDPLFAAITYVLAALLILILILYIPRLVAWTGVFAKYPHLKNEKRNRIAVLVPARNEGDAVKPLLDTLAHQTYSDFEVFLIVKDPNDPNIKVAEDLGFHAHVEKNQKCKSDALDGVLQKILSEGRERFDAYLILDADTMIKENYLEEMNNALASGRDVVVSRKIVKNYFMGDGALSIQGTANGYIWTVFDDMGNKWKSLHGISLFTIGTGVMISKKIMLHNNGWPYHATLTEDCEFAADIIANHWTTYFAPYAPIYMEEAPTLRMTNMRRNRWVPGLIATYRLYFRKVVTFGNFWDVYFSYSMCLAFMYFGLLFLGFFVYGIIGLIFLALNQVFVPYLLASVGCLAVAYLSFFIMALFAFFASFRDVKGHFFYKLATLFVVPIHFFGYAEPVIIGIFNLAPSTWAQIERIKTKEVN